MASPFSEKEIAELLSPFLGGKHLSDAQLCHVSTYLDLLLRWNSRINLTAVRDPGEIITRHFGESFFAARHLLQGNASVQDSPRVSRVPHFSPPLREVGTSNPNDVSQDAVRLTTAIDIGSGAGFPGLPIKILAPKIELTLVESNQKKVAFLREVIRSVKLIGITVYPNRAEHLNYTADLVTIRAVEQFETILPIAAKLISPQGRLALLIGISQFEAAKLTLARAMPQIGTDNSQNRKVTWAEPIPVPLSRNRILAIADCS